MDLSLRGICKMESDETLLKELESVQNLNTLTVLNNMINKGDNIPLKTDIKNPKALALLKTISHISKSKGYDLPSSYIDFFIDILLVYRISELRKSRIEVKEVLCAQMAIEKNKMKNELEGQFK